MTPTYWATIKLGREEFKTGPHATRDEAIQACEAKLADAEKSQVWRKRNAWKRFTITSGYGAFGAHFDIRFRDLTVKH